MQQMNHLKAQEFTLFKLDLVIAYNELRKA